MNLRDIKKDIDYVLSAFIEDCALCVAVNPNADESAVSDLMDDAIDLYNELRDKVVAKVDGSKKAYYNDLRKEILERTDALYTKLSEAVANGNKAKEEKPAEKKAPAKKAPAKKAEEKPAEEEKPVKKAPAKKTTAKKAEETGEKKAPAKKAPAKKTTAKKEVAE